MGQRVLTWQHVYGHTGAVDNEYAERAAARGSTGEVSEDSQRMMAPEGIFPRVRGVPAAQLKVHKPNRAAAWEARRRGEVHIGRAQRRTLAKAKAKGKAKAKATDKAKAKAKPKAKTKVKAKGKAKARGGR